MGNHKSKPGHYDYFIKELNTLKGADTDWGNALFPTVQLLERWISSTESIEKYTAAMLEGYTRMIYDECHGPQLVIEKEEYYAMRKELKALKKSLYYKYLFFDDVMALISRHRGNLNRPYRRMISKAKYTIGRVERAIDYAVDVRPVLRGK